MNPLLLEKLVCPLTRTRLVYDKDKQELISDVAGLVYPIRNGIPILIPAEARTLAEQEPKTIDAYTH
jgi:uncharacterized protein YbaR (Trm112 family)